MTRFYTNTASYGATSSGSSSSSQPPPYPGYASPSGTGNGGLPLNKGPSLLSRTLNSRMFIALATFIVTIGLCASTFPMKYCDDPIDPQARDRIRSEWAREALEHEKQVVDREIVKAQWAWENDQHAALLREWEQERIQHKQQLEERARREEEERERLDLFWSREAHQCKTYGTREYTAVLMNLPEDWKLGVQACKATPLDIHGISRFPKSCEDRGHGVVIGLWEIDQYEPDCTTYWDDYNDKGCTSPGSRKRHYTHKLMNLPEGSDWREFCATTPISFNHMQFSGSEECFTSVWGVYGRWEVYDSGC